MEQSGTLTVPLSAREEAGIPPRRHWMMDLMVRLLTTKPLGTFGAVLVLIMVMVAMFAPWIAPYDPNIINGSDALAGAGSKYWLGTDPLGRDVFSRIVWGARVSLLVGFTVILLNTLVSTTIGLLSAYIGGWFDFCVQRLVDAFMSIPWMVLMLLVISILGQGTFNVIVALVLAGWAGNSRVIRGAVLATRESEYVLAAKATGCKERTIILQHILPNIAAPILVLSTLGLGNIILAEAALSFLGLGVQPPDPSWGRMLSNDGIDYMLDNPGLAIWPGLAISITVFGFNMLGDALRDLLDPKLQGR